MNAHVKRLHFYSVTTVIWWWWWCSQQCSVLGECAGVDELYPYSSLWEKAEGGLLTKWLTDPFPWREAQFPLYSPHFTVTLQNSQSMSWKWLVCWQFLKNPANDGDNRPPEQSTYCVWQAVLLLQSLIEFSHLWQNCPHFVFVLNLLLCSFCSYSLLRYFFLYFILFVSIVSLFTCSFLPLHMQNDV